MDSDFVFLMSGLRKESSVSIFTGVLEKNSLKKKVFSTIK